jgi:hypothetical protein
MNTTQILEETKGYQVAMSFKPFIDPRCSEHGEIVKDMAKSINSAIQYAIVENIKNANNENLIMRVEQFLSSLDYGKLTDFQAKCALLLEQELKN